MDIHVTSQVLSALEMAARSAHPQEACGILIGGEIGGQERITGFIETANVHPSPADHFEIDPQALINAHRDARSSRDRGGEGDDRHADQPVARPRAVLGYFHSHPRGGARPSATDISMAHADGSVWAIFGAAGAGDSGANKGANKGANCAEDCGEKVTRFFRAVKGGFAELSLVTIEG